MTKEICMPNVQTLAATSGLRASSFVIPPILRMLRGELQMADRERNYRMKTVTLTFPELFLLVATRALLGAGIALLVARRLSDEQRRTAGTILAGIGLFTTIPLALEVLGKTKIE